MSVFSDDLRKKIESLVDRYETRRTSILPVLHAIQEEHGYVKEEHVDELEEVYGLHRVHVKEVITFYDIFKDEPVAKYQIRFCDNVTCRMLGSAPAIERIEKHIKDYEKSGEGESPFSCEAFPCLGKCDGAPVMLVNKDRVEHVTEDKVDEVLERYAPLPKS